jgi:hypothetical protein
VQSIGVALVLCAGLACVSRRGTGEWKAGSVAQQLGRMAGIGAGYSPYSKIDSSDTFLDALSTRTCPNPRGFFPFPLEAEVTGNSKTGEAGRKVAIPRADARASELAPVVADIRRSGVTSWYGIAMELNKRGVPTATGKGISEPGAVRRLIARLK